MRRRFAVLIVALLASTAACSSGGGDSVKYRTIAAVAVSGGFDSAPKVDFPKPFTVKSTQRKVLHKGAGSGPTVTAKSIVGIKFVEYVGRDGVSVGNNTANRIRPWTATTAPYTFPVSSAIKGLRSGLLGLHAGDVVLVTMAARDAFDPTGNGTTVAPGDSIVAVVKLVSVTSPLTGPQGKKVTAPASVPGLVLSSAGVPTGFKKTATTPPNVSTLGVHLLIKGNGAAVKPGQSLTVDYLGALYPDGKVFDESYTKQPVTVDLNHVITGWSKGLVGQPVGSRVILTIPSALGYGKAGGGSTIPKNADLIFVIDILAAS